MGRLDIIASREPLASAGSESVRAAIVDSGALARLFRDWNARITPAGRVVGKRGPAFAKEQPCRP